MRRHDKLLALLLALLPLVAYARTISTGGWIWDDDDYVTENETLESVDGLVRIWTEPTSIPQYYPLVHTTYWIEARLWGVEPMGYHAVNVLLHAAGVVLLFLLLRRLSVPGALFAAALFAVHPAHVETVAWVTERKNVLSGALYLGAALAWFRFRPPDEDGRSGGARWYWIALLCFLGALLSKTVTSSLPAALLVVTWWKRGRIEWKRDVLPLLPWVLLGLALGMHTAWLERTHVGAAGADWDLTFAERTRIAGRVPWFYLGKLLWPNPLNFIYPRWSVATTPWVFPIAAGLVVVSLWALRGRIGRGPLAAALFFGGSLLPASGYFDVYPMRFSFVADHFQYLASLGPIVLFASASTWAATRVAQPGPLLVGVALVLVAVLGVVGWRQQADYTDQITLWRHTVERNPDAWIAHDNLGYFAQGEGRADEAVYHFGRAAELRPRDPNAFNTLGTAHVFRAVGLGPGRSAADLSAAEAAYERALAIDPLYGMAYRNLGTVSEQRGDLEEAVQRYRRALSIDAEDAEAHVLLANLCFRRLAFEEAEQHYRRALEIAPLATTHSYLGMLLERTGRVDEAVEELRRALQLDASEPLARGALQRLGVGG